MPSFLSPLLRDPSRQFRLMNTRTGAVVADHLIGAFDSESRRTGLLHHQSMPAGTAMIIAPTNAIHTFFMKFAIDVLFVAKDGRVVKARGAVRPWRMSAAWRAHAVIELSAGTLQRTIVQVGDHVTVVPNPT
jgi:uncharacterized membrane protein (UPF0127 family)